MIDASQLRPGDVIQTSCLRYRVTNVVTDGDGLKRAFGLLIAGLHSGRWKPLEPPAVIEERIWVEDTTWTRVAQE